MWYSTGQYTVRISCGGFKLISIHSSAVLFIVDYTASGCTEFALRTLGRPWHLGHSRASTVYTWRTPRLRRTLKLFGLPGLGAGQADGIGRGDRYLTNSSWALLPFGHSLSYTSFSVGLALGCVVHECVYLTA